MARNRLHSLGLDNDEEEERTYFLLCNFRTLTSLQSSMAVFDFFENMHDSRLKPRLLKSMIQDRLPDDKQPFQAPHELAAVVSTIKTHALLSESFLEPCDPKLVESWKLAMDTWVEHLLSLISSNMVLSRLCSTD